MNFNGNGYGQGDEQSRVSYGEFWEVGHEGNRGQRAGEGELEEHFREDEEGGRSRGRGGIED